MTRLIDDCFFTDRVRLSHEEALSHLNDRVPVVTATERVPIAIASGRILAESITAAIPVPAHSNAAVDGYAFAIGDLQRSADGLFPSQVGQRPVIRSVTGRLPARRYAFSPAR